MIEQRGDTIFNYWGKADDKYPAEPKWHPQQQNRTLADGSYELRVPYSDSRELVMGILKHGAEVEVIAPEELRREVLEHLRQAAEKYTTRKMRT